MHGSHVAEGFVAVHYWQN